MVGPGYTVPCVVAVGGAGGRLRGEGGGDILVERRRRGIRERKENEE